MFQCNNNNDDNTASILSKNIEIEILLKLKLASLVLLWPTALLLVDT